VVREGLQVMPLLLLPSPLLLLLPPPLLLPCLLRRRPIRQHTLLHTLLPPYLPAECSASADVC
jgi:hypothetical protein